MRISDWSSDVCSSDLAAIFPLDEHQRLPPRALFGDGADRDLVEDLPPLCLAERAGEDRRILVERDPGQPAADDRLADLFGQVAGALGFRIRLGEPGLEDRKSVVEGQSVSVSVDPGCRRNNKTK